MSKKQILTLVLAVTALTAQIAFAAELPGNVKSVTASITNGKLTAMWTPVQGAAYYRVYFSHESIIGNEGNYDDFERTLAAETSHAFAAMPLSSDKIYIGVLAVDMNGNESEGFETEASVEQPKAPSAPEPPPAPVEPEMPLDPLAASGQPEQMPLGVNPTTTSEPMNIVSVAAVSSTGVLVTFTKNVAIDVQVNPGFFLVTDSGGAVLPIQSVEVNAATVLLKTDAQVPGRSYAFALLQPLPAGDGTNAIPSSEGVLFTGFGTPEQPQEPQQPAYGQNPMQQPGYGQNPMQQPDIPYGQNPMLGGQQPMPPQGGYGQNPMLAGLMDPVALDLQASPRKDGTYDVIARWNGVPSAQNYGLYTAVNGQPYAWNGQVGPEQTTVQYSRVKPGSFALRVTARTGQGQESRGIERSIPLPATGIGLIGVMAAAGAAAGVRMRRRKQAV